MKPVSSLRDAIAARPASLFAHDAYPLANTLEYRGDPGLFGPGSPTWSIAGDVATFVGGIRALLIQAAHPEVVAGVDDHSVFEDDPLGRLSRTSSYVTATAFGSMPEVDTAIGRVRKAHRPVAGVSHRARAYTASAPDLSAWVHNALTASFLATHTAYGPGHLSPDRADAFVAEQTRLGAMLRAQDLPTTAGDLHRWIAEHPELEPSPGMRRTVAFMQDPPLSRGLRMGYDVLFDAAVETIPERLRLILGLKRNRIGAQAGALLVRSLRWTMGSSPSWWIALQRMDAPRPDGVQFLRPPPAVGAEELFESVHQP